MSGLFGSTISETTRSQNQTEVINSLTSKSLNKDDFLKLLLAQMQHQDPLNPLENTDFLGQLSQFSQLEQIYQVNENLYDLTSSQNSIRDSLIVNLLGKTVKAEAYQLYLDNPAEGVNLNYELTNWANKVIINIYDENSYLVKSIERENQDGGSYEFLWDGTNKKGENVRKGNFTFEVTSYNGNESTWIKPYMIGQISGINFSDGQSPMVQIGNQTVPIGKVSQIIEQQIESSSEKM